MAFEDVAFITSDVKESPVFFRTFRLDGAVQKAVLDITGLGLYTAFINGKKAGDAYLAPGFNDYDGAVYDKDGLDQEKLAFLKELVFVKRGSLREYVKKFPRAEFHEGKKTWFIPCYAAFPTACENELKDEDAATLIKNGVKLVCEGANMPCTLGAVKQFQEAGVLYSPGKASNAGGVGVSGLEMTQNSIRLSWPAKKYYGPHSQLLR